MSNDAVDIADKAMDALQAGFVSTFTTFRRQPMLQMTPDELPALGVFIMRERRTADGDANAGPVQFVCDLTLGVSISAAIRSDDLDQLSWVEDRCSDVDALLFENPEFMGMVESVISTDRVSQYAQQGETALSEIRLEIVVRYRQLFKPVLVDDFKTLHIETRYPSKDVDPAEVQQVSASIDIPQE